MAHFVLTTCGTSLLTNGADAATRKLLGATANAQTNELDPEQISLFAALGERKRIELETASIGDAARMSAELNGLLAFYNFNPSAQDRRQDTHMLLASDTHAGQLTRELASGWLTSNGFLRVSPLDIGGLRTDSLANFRLATVDLLENIEALTTAHREAHSTIHFNLAGGFKSVNAFIQTLGALWADEVFFIFESSRELMRIPGLPVQLDLAPTVRQHLAGFRRLYSLGQLPAGAVSGLPSGLLLEVGGQAALNTWAQAAFVKVREELYAERLWPAWDSRVEFGQNFESSVQGHSPAEIALVNQRIDDFCRYVETNDNLKRLDFKPLHGHPVGGGVTHEFDAWAHGSAKRVFVSRRNTTWVLERLDKALH